MSELLFECYNIPSVCYGVDALFGYYCQPESLAKAEDVLIVSLGYQCCHVIPILYNQVVFEHTRRLNTGTTILLCLILNLVKVEPYCNKLIDLQ